MATKTYNIEEHKRKILLNNLSLKTTKSSLTEYLSEFELDFCWITFEEGRSNGYGFVLFREESSANTVMSRRPHIIDGQQVELYRSVPDQGPLRDTKGIKELIVSGFNKGSIMKSDLERHFRGFGKINSITWDENDDSYSIEFDDYDSVDVVLLCRPHTIKNIEVELTKASRKGRFEPAASAKSNPAAPRQRVVRPPQDSDRSTSNLPQKFYCIHIQNLSPNVDAEYLSKQFNWSMGNILMSSSTDNQSSSSSVECWLKGIDKLQTAEDFVENYDGQIIAKSKIECDTEEDRFEFCHKFRLGTCPMAHELCYWEHIPCTANGRCPTDCPYGHKEGIKTGFINNSSLNGTYQIKLSGFQKGLTQDGLSQALKERNCFINPSDDHVGYIGPLKTMKHARRLFAKWHNKLLNGQKLQCQIEFNQRSSMSKGSSNAGSTNILSKSESRNYIRDTFSSRDDSDSEIRVLDDNDINYEGRLFDRSVGGILKQKEADKLKTKPTVNCPSPINSNCQSLDELSEGVRKMTIVQRRTEHGSYAFLVEYNIKDEQMCRRELNALRLLKGVKGVLQSVDLARSVHDGDERSASRSNPSIIAEYKQGYRLRKYFSQIHRGDLGVLQAIQIVQNLITIVREVHAHGVLNQNLTPESILIEWDPKQTSADQAKLLLVDFSQAHIKSERSTPMDLSTLGYWYKAPQADVESFKYSSTIDASSICGILLWLLTNIDPRHNQNVLPHQQDNVRDKLIKKIAQATRSANDTNKMSMDESQLKKYLVDTFDIGFGYPQYQPWTIGDLECRMECIRELLLPKNPRLNTTDAIFKQLASTLQTPLPTSSTSINVHQDIFQKAAIAFQEAKRKFVNSNDEYSWSDGGCTWLKNAMNERRHDDILTFDYRDGRTTGRCSIIITCLANLIDRETCIALSISSTVNGRISRIPIGCYSRTQNFATDLQKNFTIELNNLVKSILKEQNAVSQ